MMLFVLYAISASLFLLYLLHKYTSRNFDYWKKRNLPFLKPKPFVGNFLDVCLRKCDLAHQFGKLYDQCNAPYFGAFAFSKPILIVKDHEIIKHILIKDFDRFVNRNMLSSEHDPATAPMLFVANGKDWKITRSALTSFFSTNKLKNMFSAIDDIAKLMQKYIQTQKDEPFLEAKNLCLSFSTDVITKCVFAINSNSFSDVNPEFKNASEKIFDSRIITALRLICFMFLHPLARIFRMSLIDPTVTSFLGNVLWQSIRTREEKDLVGNDLLDIIIQLRKNEKFRETVKFDGPKVIAQAMNFFVAGMETISSTISFALYELCLNPEEQEKLREDIESTLEKWNGQLNYESLSEMKYLDMVVKETLRMYPALPFLDRVCNADYKIPGSNFIIEAGTSVVIPILSVHRDPELFTKPDQFIPERFETSKRDCSYLPFGQGPRMCIGERLGLLATKLGLVRILTEFEVQKMEKTPVNLVYNPAAIMLASAVGLPMKFRKIERQQ